jgi:hypothetical protein
MVNVNEVKIFIDSIANKEQSGTSYSIIQLNNWFYGASTELFKQRYGLPEEYIPGSPVPRMGYEVTQKIKDDLKAFKVVIDLPIDSMGEMAIPTDYGHKTAITFKKVVNQCCGEPPTTSYNTVDILDDNKYAERSSNSIKFPSFDFPICNFLSDKIRFMPKDLKEVEFSYLRNPIRPVWAYTSPNGVEIYDAANSVDFEWSEILFTDISRIILGYIGINLRDDELNLAIQTYKAKGI